MSTSYKIALRWMPQNTVGDKSALVQGMAWCHQAASHYLRPCSPRSMSPYGVTRPVRPQWIDWLFRHMTKTYNQNTLPQWPVAWLHRLPSMQGGLMQDFIVSRLWISVDDFDKTAKEKAENDQSSQYPDSKVHGANMGPIWGRQDPGGPHVGPMNFVIWVV